MEFAAGHLDILVHSIGVAIHSFHLLCHFWTSIDPGFCRSAPGKTYIKLRFAAVHPRSLSSSPLISRTLRISIASSCLDCSMF